MENNSTLEDDDQLQAKLRRKRRRKRRKSLARSDNNDILGDDHSGWRHHTTAATTSSSNCNALDAELENQVNKLIMQSNHDKKKRLATDSCYNTTSSTCAVNTKSPNDMSTSLPMLLHIRELGLSSHLGRHRRQIPFVSNVDSLDVNGNNASWMTLLLHQPAYPRRRKERMEQHRRHSGLTLDTAAANNNAHRDNFNDTNGASWLRVAVQNHGHALHNDDDDCYNKDSLSKYASTMIYRRKAWRPYTQQTIQFSKLKTPHSVAILAMDQWGGYSIGVVGRGDLSLIQPSLSLKFYGIPSPARLLSSSSGQSSTSSSVTSPLAYSIPLLLNNQYNNKSGSEEAPIQISDTPIQILLCSNGAFGVGYVLDSRATAPLRSEIFPKSPALQDDLTGTVVIFETPRDGAATTKSFHCCNVRIGGWKSFTMRNALWPAVYVPLRPSANCRNVHELSSLMFDTNVSSAHILFNDEDDGFRITWIQPFKEEACDCSSRATRIPLPSHKIQAVRTDIITLTDEHETWEECLSDPRTGLIHQGGNDDTGSPHTITDCSPQLDIAFEVYLHIDALLIDIITRRQQSSFMFQMSPYQSDTVRFIPNFYYNLISVSGDGLDVTLVIVFSNKEKMIMQSSQPSSNNKKKLPAALGVVIKLSIFNQSYDELRWVQHLSCEDDPSMKQWCNSLALNWRMKECGVGVFCLEQTTLKNDTWRSATHERNVDEDLEDDFNCALWSKFNVQKEEVKKAKSRIAVAPPKDISMSSLYPHCDVITNRAVYDAIPVKKISSRKSPTEMIYG